jgi:erythronate-4-phosphate dehydrogenase
VGVVGVGEVGSRLVSTLEALGVRCVRCDPPRAENGEPGLVTLEALIAAADVITCHVPLLREGDHPTYHLFDHRRLKALRQGVWLINSSRGPVINNQALAEVLSQRNDLQVALDVWEHEPEVDFSLMQLCALATPHIAGYSLDGKLRGTAQIYAALCAYAQQPALVQLADLAPDAGRAQLSVHPDAPAEWLLSRALRWVYDVRDDDARMRNRLTLATDEAGRQAGFDRLRKKYPLRREAGLLTIAGSDELPADSRALISAAGFLIP